MSTITIKFGPNVQDDIPKAVDEINEILRESGKPIRVFSINQSQETGMTLEEFKALKRGDIVRNIGRGNSYVIAHSMLDSHVGVDTIVISNPSEWIKVEKKD